MTLEELQKLLEEERQKTAQYEQNMSKQNSYITKLEAENQALKKPAAPTQVPNPSSNAVGIDPSLTKYIQKQMRKDTIAEAMSQINASVSKEVVDAIKPDLDKFLDDTMNLNNTTVAYVIDAFNLLYGRAMRDKEHPLNKKAAPNNTQRVNPAPLNTVNQMLAQTPPVMSPQDVSATSGMPVINQNAGFKNTNEALKAFKSKISGNPFQ